MTGQHVDGIEMGGIDRHPALRVAALPAPSKDHATCPWCGRSFTGIVDLLDHVEPAHVAERAQDPRHVA